MNETQLCDQGENDLVFGLARRRDQPWPGSVDRRHRGFLHRMVEVACQSQGLRLCAGIKIAAVKPVGIDAGGSFSALFMLWLPATLNIGVGFQIGFQQQIKAVAGPRNHFVAREEPASH